LRAALCALHFGGAVESDVYEQIVIEIAAFLVWVSRIRVAAIRVGDRILGGIVRAPAVFALNDAERVIALARVIAPSLRLPRPM